MTNKRELYDSGTLKGIVSIPPQKASTLLIALHGVGSNEKDLISVAEEISPVSIVISLRSPIELSSNAYSWFQVQFTPTGPVHNWNEAKANFALLEKEILYISQKYEIPLSLISVMGFSQGSIMTMGLLLQSSLELGHYLCFSGRTLPEFAAYALANPMTKLKKKLFLAHGTHDSTLPVKFARESKSLLEKLNIDMTYKEFEGGHGLTGPIIREAKNWLQKN